MMSRRFPQLALIPVFAIFAMSQPARATDCSANDIELTSQVAVDTFQATYGGGGTCDTVTGSLVVRGDDPQNSSGDITNLNGLHDLTRVGGDLRIRTNALLTNLDGLANLTSVGGDLDFSRNRDLINIDGLSGLAGKVGYVSFYQNYSLTNIGGLVNVTTAQRLEIYDNHSLGDLDGLVNLVRVELNFYLYYNPSLTGVDGLAKLASVGESLHIFGNGALANLDGLANLTSVGSLLIDSNSMLTQCAGLSRLLDQWDDAEPGPGPGYSGIPDVREDVDLRFLPDGCSSIEEILDENNTSRINVGHNDAWYDPETDGQGFFITVFPERGVVFLAWFTYETEIPPDDVKANLGWAGHRWLTAMGPISGNQVILDIDFTSGGIFDTPTDVQHTDPPGSAGTIILTFSSCNSGAIEYDIPSIGMQGIVPIQRVADENTEYCEALNTQ